MGRLGQDGSCGAHTSASRAPKGEHDFKRAPHVRSGGISASDKITVKPTGMIQAETERHRLHEENFNGDGAVVSYLSDVRTTKETDVVQIVNDAQGADDMSDHDEWISYSHWGMFTLGRKSSN